MRTIFSSLALPVVLSCAPAAAADMAVKAPAPIAVSAYNWTGPYLGANIGYGWGTSNNTYGFAPTGGPDITVGSDQTSLSGAIGGLQIGYNWQAQRLLFGIESDIQASGLRGNGTFLCSHPLCAALGGVSTLHAEKLPWFATLRGRAGLIFDEWAVYGTGGLAYGHIESVATTVIPAGSVTFADSTTRMGWTIGAGVERKLVGNWTWKAEYLYMDFGSPTFRNPVSAALVPGGGTDVQSNHVHDHVVRIGLNYRL
jgi:outer membrane immunogenic protein